MSPGAIVNKYQIFSDIQEVIEWTEFIFQMAPSDVVRLLTTGNLKIDYKGRFGLKDVLGLI